MNSFGLTWYRNSNGEIPSKYIKNYLLALELGNKVGSTQGEDYGGDATDSLLAEDPEYEVSQYYVHPDHLGSASFITDINGETYQHVEYLPFGEVFTEERNTEQDRFTYLYNAKELDEMTGLYYFGFRYYDSRINMFLGVDPLVEKFSWVSPFNYAENSPISNIDLWGLQAWYAADGSLINTDFGEAVAGPISNMTANKLNATSYGILETSTTSVFSKEDYNNLRDFGDNNTNSDCFEVRRDAASILIGDQSIKNILWSNEKTFGDKLNEKGYLANSYQTEWDYNLYKSDNTGFSPTISEYVANSVSNEKGLFAFGLSVGSGYHTMTMLFDNTGETPKYSLLDNKRGWSPTLRNFTSNSFEGRINTVSKRGREHYFLRGNNLDKLTMNLYQYQKNIRTEKIYNR
jgi:RHS repeat-associated protein